jgi:hypothetical protein
MTTSVPASEEIAGAGSVTVGGKGWVPGAGYDLQRQAQACAVSIPQDVPREDAEADLAMVAASCIACNYRLTYTHRVREV